MVLVLFGDTHELHREVEVPAGDILICVGDFTLFSKNLSAIEDFNEWLGELPHRHKIVVPGNHEFFLESNPERRSLLDNANVLIDEGIEIEGLLCLPGWRWRWAPSPPPIRQVRKDGTFGPSYN